VSFVTTVSSYVSNATPSVVSTPSSVRSYSADWSGVGRTILMELPSSVTSALTIVTPSIETVSFATTELLSIWVL